MGRNGRDQGLPGVLEAPGFDERAGRSERPARRGILQRMPERFMRCVISVLLAASTTPEPMGSLRSLRVR